MFLKTFKLGLCLRGDARRDADDEFDARERCESMREKVVELSSCNGDSDGGEVGTSPFINVLGSELLGLALSSIFVTGETFRLASTRESAPSSLAVTTGKLGAPRRMVDAAEVTTLLFSEGRLGSPLEIAGKSCCGP
jgi:hypothetical protein